MNSREIGRYDRPRKGGMAIVLIEWSIYPNQKAIDDFMVYWTAKAKFDKGGLFGEFLSAPVPADELDLPVWVDDLGAGNPKFPTVKFVNVGIWKNRQTFYEQIGRLMKEGPQEFEAAPRRRIVLEPQELRRGDWDEFPPPTCE